VFPKCKQCGLTVRFKLIRTLESNDNPNQAPFYEILVPFHEEDRRHMADVKGSSKHGAAEKEAMPNL
jgi:hypothetical protein